jgi:predicted RNase H-like HicB family nuclease
LIIEVINMTNQFHAIYERDGEWIIGYCPEIPGANGMGKTQDECRTNLADAIRLILNDRYEDTIRGLKDNFTDELITVQ